MTPRLILRLPVRICIRVWVCRIRPCDNVCCETPLRPLRGNRPPIASLRPLRQSALAILPRAAGQGRRLLSASLLRAFSCPLQRGGRALRCPYKARCSTREVVRTHSEQLTLLPKDSPACRQEVLNELHSENRVDQSSHQTSSISWPA